MGRGGEGRGGEGDAAIAAWFPSVLISVLIVVLVLVLFLVRLLFKEVCCCKPILFHV